MQQQITHTINKTDIMKKDDSPLLMANRIAKRETKRNPIAILITDLIVLNSSLLLLKDCPNDHILAIYLLILGSITFSHSYNTYSSSPYLSASYAINVFPSLFAIHTSLSMPG